MLQLTCHYGTPNQSESKGIGYDDVCVSYKVVPTLESALKVLWPPLIFSIGISASRSGFWSSPTFEKFSNQSSFPSQAPITLSKIVLAVLARGGRAHQPIVTHPPIFSQPSSEVQATVKKDSPTSFFDLIASPSHHQQSL